MISVLYWGTGVVRLEPFQEVTIYHLILSMFCFFQIEMLLDQNQPARLFFRVQTLCRECE